MLRPKKSRCLSIAWKRDIVREAGRLNGKLIGTAMVLLLFLLAACRAGTEPSGQRLTIYGPARDSREVVESRELFCPDGTAVLEFAVSSALELLRERGVTENRVSLRSYQHSGGTVTLLLSEGYGLLSGYGRTVADACLVLTLTELADVDGIALTVEGETPLGSPLTLRRDDFIMGLPDTLSTGGGNALYFTDAEGRYAHSELRTMVLREDEGIERYLLLELIAGPKREGLLPVIPPDTELRSVRVEEGVCTVDFSRAFVDNGSAEGARMTLCCVVATLCDPGEVEGVVLLVEGEALESYFGLDCQSPLRADPYVQASALSGQRDLDMYFPDSEGQHLMPVPVTLAATDDRAALAYSALSLLIRGGAPLGMSAALPADALVRSVTETSWGFMVDFSAGFSRTEPPVSPELALQAVARLLAQIKPGASVSFTQGGQTLSSYQGYALPERLSPGRNS